ncbi:MAG: response regulator [Puniceicoccaceae bacterium]
MEDGHIEGMSGAAILIVEDDPEFGKLLESYAELSGYLHRSVISAGAAFDIIGQEAFDLIITDYLMPGTSGLAMARRVRAAGYTLPIVLLSGHLTTRLYEEARKSGVNRVLAKPLTLELFRTETAEVLGRYRLGERN